MNLELNEAIELIQKVNNNQDDVRVIVFPSSVFIKPIADVKNENIEVGTQNFHTEPKGADDVDDVAGLEDVRLQLGADLEIARGGEAHGESSGRFVPGCGARE